MECNQNEVARSTTLMNWLVQDDQGMRVFLMDMDEYNLSCGILSATVRSGMTIYPFDIDTQLDGDGIDRMLDRIHMVYNAKASNKTVVFINFHIHGTTTKDDVERMVNAYVTIYKLLSPNNDRCIVHVSSDDSMVGEIMEDYFITTAICDSQTTDCPYAEHVTVTPVKTTDDGDVYRCDIGYFMSVHLVVDEHRAVIPLSNISSTKKSKMKQKHRVEAALSIVG